MSLIPNWRKAWRMFSVQFSTLAIVWLALPDDKQLTVLRLLPGMTEDELTIILIALAVVGRLVLQPKVRA